MTEPSSHYTTVHNLRLHYLEAGAPEKNGDPVLLLHGFPTSSHLYRNILPELAKTHRAIALDLPGYGLSDKPLDVTYDYNFFTDVLNDFLDALGIKETNLVVHDLGGPVGLYWAIQNPGRVPKLIILNTLVYPETSWAVKLFLIAMKTPGLRDFLVSPKGLVGAMQFGVANKARLNREVLTPYTAPFQNPRRPQSPHQSRQRPRHRRPSQNRPRAPRLSHIHPPHLRRKRPHPPRRSQNHGPPKTRPPRSRAHRAAELRPLPPRRRPRPSRQAHRGVPQRRHLDPQASQLFTIITTISDQPTPNRPRGQYP